jgi:hypothetical protein
MILNAPTERGTVIGDPTSRQSFLTSHRATAVLGREFARLAKELFAAAKYQARNDLEEVPTIRQAPDHCIVQFGPVALSVAWLRNGSDQPAAGQLMAIVWNGVIAPRGDHSPERNGMRRARATPVAVWEESYVVSAENEESWHWHPEGAGREGYASPELAARCIEQLGIAYRAVTATAPAGTSQTD